MLKRPLVSPAMVVALLALVVALTGTSYAAVKINGKNIQKESIPGNRLKPDAVTGAQVNEAQLGPVPRAQDAATLGGLPPASFLQNASAFLAAGGKAADSNLLDGVDSSGFLAAGGKAADSNLLDGVDSSGFLAAGGKAADSNLLDGIDSTGFVQGGGNVDGQSLDTGPNTTAFLGPAIGGLVRFRYQCPASLGGNGILRIANVSAGAANVFVDSGGANPDFLPLGAGGFFDYPAAAGGESFYVQAQGSAGVVLASVATVHQVASSNCHAQAVALLAP